MAKLATLIQKRERKVVGDEYDYLRSAKPRVYLSGAMDNVSEEERKAWRRVTGELLSHHNIQAVNPYDFEPSNPKVLVRTDLHEVLRCQGMIINASQDVEVWGTPMEVLWAHMHRVINIAFVGELEPSPWLSYHAKVVPTLEQAVEVMAWEIRQL